MLSQFTHPFAIPPVRSGDTTENGVGLRKLALSRIFSCKISIIVLSLMFVVMGAMFLEPVAQAQGTTADVLGTVTDSTGAVIPNASVTITNTGTKSSRKSVSDGRGEYGFSLLQIGDYKIRVEAAGFKALELPKFTLTVGERRRVDAGLSIGTQNETVEVSTAPPALQSDSTTLGDTLEPQAVQDLPTEGRNIYSLVDMAPGANFGPANGISSGNRSADRRQSSEVSVNGQSDALNYNMLDGMDNNESQWNIVAIRPSIDAIEEVSVSTSNYPATISSTAGAAVNVLTKSGTNSFHGTAYEYFRNDLFDSRDFFASTANGIAKKPEWRQNQFGASVGGPIKRDKMFFFADVEDLRKIEGQTQSVVVPTSYEHDNIGDFSDIGGPTLPSYFLDPAGKAIYKLYPKPTNNSAPVGTPNFTASPHYSQSNLTADGRADYHLTTNDSMFARFSYNNVTTLTPGIFPEVVDPSNSKIMIQPGGNIYGFQGTAYEKAYNGMISYNHIFTPNLVLEAKTAYTRFYNNYVTLNDGNNVSADLGMAGVNVGSTTTGLAAIYPIDGYASVGDSTYEPDLSVINTMQEMATLSYTRGKHSFQAGASLIRRQQNGYYAGAYPVGYYYFGDDNALSPMLPALSMADLLMGVSLEGQRQLGMTTTQARTWESGIFLQDDWRITPKITLNLGVRYDVYTPARDAKNEISTLGVTNQSLTAATFNMITASSSNPTAGLKTDYSNIAPRVGFAATVRNGTVVRGAFGMSYIPRNSYAAITYNPPFTYSYGPNYAVGLDESNILYEGSFGYAGAPLNDPNAKSPGYNPLPTLPSQIATSPVANLTGALAAVSPNLRSSYMEQFNLNFQQQLGQNVITLAYVGELGRKLIAQPNVDLPDPYCGTSPYTGTLPASGFTTACPIPINPQTGSPVALPARYGSELPNVNTITQTIEGGASSFHALEVTFIRHLSHGLSVNANYTWAHELDDVANNTYSTSPWGLEPFNWQHYDYGNSDNDLRHRIAGSVVYNFPFTKSYTGLSGVLAKNWQLNVLGYWQTGQPFTVGNQSPRIDIGGAIFIDRPQQIGSWETSNPSISKAFNTASFAKQPWGYPGSERRNQLYGMHQRRADLSLFRDFAILKEMKLQFRAEVYNATNTPNFAAPTADINNQATFGTISSTTQSDVRGRVYQFAGKFVF